MPITFDETVVEPGRSTHFLAANRYRPPPPQIPRNLAGPGSAIPESAYPREPSANREHSAHPSVPGELAGPESCPSDPTIVIEGYHSNYIPHPKIHFLLGPELAAGCTTATSDPDAPAVEMVCTICYTSDLRFRSARRQIDDHTPAILPCGHVVGYACLNRWLHIDSTCPVCRFPCVYEDERCRHPIPCRAVTKENIHFLPTTVPAGGKVPRKCAACTLGENQMLAKEKWDRLAVRYREAIEDGDEERARSLRARLDTVVLEVQVKPKGLGLTGRW